MATLINDRDHVYLIMEDVMITTQRTLMRKLSEIDREGFYEMDSDPEVHKYIFKQPIINVEEAEEGIRFIQSQYKKYGTGRLAVVDRNSNEFLGWCGIKFIEGPWNNVSDFYELGYRFTQKHWGKGYATETASAILDYAFANLPTDVIYAITDPENSGSRHVLEKLGFVYHGLFDLDGSSTTWYILTKESWVNRANKR